MTLTVPFDQFSKTIHRVLGIKEAYVASSGTGSIVSAATSEAGLIVVSRTDLNLDAAKSKLEHSGMTVFEGSWSLPSGAGSKDSPTFEPFVVAVAYKSGESGPGVWLDAFPALPTQVQVLRSVYDEFRETGELPEVSFEEFVRLSDPNVVIASPNDLQSYLDKKIECP